MIRFNADPFQSFYYPGSCSPSKKWWKSANTGLQTLHVSALSLNAFFLNIHGRPWLRFETLKIFKYDFDADPDRTFQANADLDFKIMQIPADPDPQLLWKPARPGHEGLRQDARECGAAGVRGEVEGARVPACWPGWAALTAGSGRWSRSCSDHQSWWSWSRETACLKQIRNLYSVVRYRYRLCTYSYEKLPKPRYTQLWTKYRQYRLVYAKNFEYFSKNSVKRVFLDR